MAFKLPSFGLLYRFSISKVQIINSQSTDSLFAKYRFSIRKGQIFNSQSTDSQFAKYRFSIRKVQISQFAKCRFLNSFRFVSQSTISPLSILGVVGGGGGGGGGGGHLRKDLGVCFIFSYC